MAQDNANMGIVDRGFEEEYYPISQDILATFPKFRPGIDLFLFDENIGVLYPFSTKDDRLSNDGVKDALRACREGRLFVSRSDHHIYVEHLAFQSDFVLVDPNLHDSEIKQILVMALTMRYRTLEEQALPIVYEALHTDIMVFTEYIWRDPKRIHFFMNELFLGEESLVTHALNCLFVGTWLYLNAEEEPTRKMFDHIAHGLILLDIGRAKLPSFIKNKKSPYTKDEMVKYSHHPRIGLTLAQKFGCLNNVVSDIMYQHHERLDGSGYPNRLVGDAITPYGKFAAVVDTFCHMIVDRPGAPRTKTLKASTLLVKDSHYAPKYTQAIFKAYAKKVFEDV